MTARWVPGFLIGLIILGGSYIRLAHLGTQDFTNDEINHYYVAQSLDRGEGPLLPSGNVYQRGIDFSRVVRVSLNLVDPPELAVRLPSALFGILGLLLLAAISWRVAGPWAAVWTTLLLAVYPEAVSQSRIGRFYMHQLLFGLIAFYAGWQTLCDAGAREGPDVSAVKRKWLWAAVALLAFLLAARVQITTFSVVAGWGVCVTLAAMGDVAARGWRSVSRSVPAQLLLLGVLALPLVLLTTSGGLSELAASAGRVPHWARLYNSGPRFYYWGLVDILPVAVSLGPVAFLVVALRNPRLAVYLTLWFGVPLTLHSFVLAWKGDRFVLLAMPALFLAVGIAAAKGAGVLYRFVQERLGRSFIRDRYARLGAGLVVAAVSLWVVATTDPVVDARRVPRADKLLRWAEAKAIVDERPDLAGVPLGGSVPKLAFFYWGQVDFGTSAGALERSGNPPHGSPPDRDAMGFWWAEQGAPEFFTATPILTTPEAIRDRFDDAGSVLIGIELWRLESGHTDPGLRQVLSEQADELCGTRCGNLLLFHWRFESAEPRFSPTLAR
jgi:hypothetical protein